MRIAEVFHSIQGEGMYAETPSVFVRTTGCNLRCWFCDTRYTSWEPEGEHRSWQAVFEMVRAFDCEHVVVTGGEPMLQTDVVALTWRLGQAGHFVTFETAGTVARPVHADLMSLSPKLSNSTPPTGPWAKRHELLRDNRGVAAQLMREYPYQLKFVIDQREDVSTVCDYLARFEDVQPDRVWLMPQAVTKDQLQQKTAWLEDEAHRLGFRVSPRLHIERFGNVRGK